MSWIGCVPCRPYNGNVKVFDIYLNHFWNFKLSLEKSKNGVEDLFSLLGMPVVIICSRLLFTLSVGDETCVLNTNWYYIKIYTHQSEACILDWIVYWIDHYIFSIEVVNTWCVMNNSSCNWNMYSIVCILYSRWEKKSSFRQWNIPYICILFRVMEILRVMK